VKLKRWPKSAIAWTKTQGNTSKVRERRASQPGGSAMWESETSQTPADKFLTTLANRAAVALSRIDARVKLFLLLPALQRCQSTIQVSILESNKYKCSFTALIDLIMCRRQPGIGERWCSCSKPFADHFCLAIGRLCEKCDGKWCAINYIASILQVNGIYSPVCDSYVRPETLVRICDECNFGTYGGRCIICGSPGTLHNPSDIYFGSL